MRPNSSCRLASRLLCGRLCPALAFEYSSEFPLRPESAGLKVIFIFIILILLFLFIFKNNKYLVDLDQNFRVFILQLHVLMKQVFTELAVLVQPFLLFFQLLYRLLAEIQLLIFLLYGVQYYVQGHLQRLILDQSISVFKKN